MPATVLPAAARRGMHHVIGARECRAQAISIEDNDTIGRFLFRRVSESTAIIVTGDRLEVVGEGKVAVHDNTRPIGKGEKPYFMLAASDAFDLKTRIAKKVSPDTQPVQIPPRE